MPSQSNSFRLITTWTVVATLDEVAAVLSDAESLPAWWGEVYLAVSIVAQGDADGIGRKIAIHSKGWLPYHLHWIGTLTESRRPHGWTITATGDLEGVGVWTLTQNGDVAEIVYDWRVNAEKPLLRLLSPILKPVFAWNHHWAMRKGEEGLRREVARRREYATRLTTGHGTTKP